MRAQQYQFGDRPWPVDQHGRAKGVLQIYAPLRLGRHPELAQLITPWRAAMTGAPVSVVEDRHLHLTMDVVAGITEDAVSEAERNELQGALRDALTGVPIYHGTIGPCVAAGSGTMLYVSPAEPLQEIQRRVREVIRIVRGEQAATWTQPRPHVSLHYCNLPDGEYEDSDPWNRLLRKAVDPMLAPLEVTEVALVDVRPDLATKDLHWTAVRPPILLAN